MGDTRTAERRIADLFVGLDRAHGVAVPSDRKDARGKVGARYVTKRVGPTDDDWRKHLLGDHCLVPIPIRDDGTAGFGAIDVDVYPLDLAALASKVRSLNLPLVVCRSKSGGAHLFLFLTEPHDAARVREVLTSWAEALGYPNAEIFPKQVNLASDRDTGNGIAAPYHGAASGPTVRYAVGPSGEPMTLREFLGAAEAARVDGDSLAETREAPPADLDEAPPCLVAWAREGVPEGQRNEVMFDFAVYLRKRWPDDWQERLDDLNKRYCNPALPATEIAAIIKSVARARTYTYRAKCEGPRCVPRLCRKAAHGRGGGYEESNVVVDGLTIVETDPPTYIVSVNGRRVELTSSEFDDQRQFRKRVMDVLHVRPRILKPKAWEQLLDRLLESAEIDAAPEDAAPRGQLALHLREFFDRHMSDDREKLVLEHCWTDPADGKTWFRSRDFADYLRRMRVGATSAADMYHLVRSLGGGSQMIEVRGQRIRGWWVPSTAKPKPSPLPVPEIPADAPPDSTPF